MLPSRAVRSALSTDHHTWLHSASGSWILALVATKTGDFVTTVTGLAIVDGLTERNPVAGAVFQRFGVVGLCLVSVVMLLAVVLVVERAATFLERYDETSIGADTVYFLGYLPLVTVFGAATVYNVLLLSIHV